MLTFSSLGNNGHLGNQMFQYAALKGIASNRGLDWVMPTKNKFGSSYYLRSNLHDCFTLINCGIENKIDIVSPAKIEERFFHFDEELFNSCPANVDLNGYFQTSKYFEHIEEDIREDFTFYEETEIAAKDFLDKIDGKYASLHIRRTDYVSNDYYHKSLGWDYYSKAIELIPADYKIIIFSDDIDWCMQQEVFNSNRFIFSTTNNPYVDLCIMSKCNANIIANSTYSWWGAWLNTKSDKIVIAPAQWFGIGYAHHNTKDLYPTDWIKI